MYQESEDRLNLGSKSDFLLLILLIIGFFAIGFAATYLRSVFNSNLPMYLLAVVVAAIVYVIYRVRILGYRYTVFFEDPKPEFDERFNDYITHEDYPYPVGTIVVERTSSAKGTIIESINKSQVITLLEPLAEYHTDVELRCCCHGISKAHSLVYTKEGKTVRLYFYPSEQLLSNIKKIIEA